ncbi:phenylacetate-CoA ligase [Azospirillum brasilense]|uniref:Phenylacetate-CoA ligase n=1 Tax=Azospirillum brasilense TaxID=192 RepID=A0A560CDD9_AZOBR|nr:phenylacetate--CoA ligase [Azospirillum brasilense]TWA82857.1 phenylacetate-CoA ligase [Azospirillum brasilense]
MNYFDALDLPTIRARYPLGPDFLRRYRGMSRDELRAFQDLQFRELMAFGWHVPFYRRLWGRHGIEPGDVRGLDDLEKLPTYSKDDLMESVEHFPPLGDFHGLDAHPDDARPPLVFQTTSGTTGKPQPLLFGPKSREVQSLFLGRIYGLQGITARDVVHSVYGHGMVNGGHYIREAVMHWVGAPLLSAGTGIETRSLNQVTLMKAFRATAIVGFGDYIKRLAEVAIEAGITPGEDIPVRIISGHLGAETAEGMSRIWGGAEVYDWYGVGDTGAIAGEGPDRSGLHIMEDGQLIELLDVDSHAPVEGDALGDIVCTCLYKTDVFPIIRFNTHDVTRFIPGDNPLGIPMRRMAGFLGRSDNMVKLRGINIYPQGIGSVLTSQFADASGEYYCEVESRDGRDEMSVAVETRSQDPTLAARMEEELRMRLGVAIAIRLCAPGDTAEVTQIERRQKPIRLIDRRKGA